MPQSGSLSTSLDQNGDTRTYSDSEYYGETRSYSGSGSYDEVYSSSYSSSDSRNDHDQDVRDDDDHYDHESSKNEKSVGETTSIDNSKKLSVDTSRPSTPSSLLSSPFGEQVFGFMKDAFSKLVEGRDTFGKFAGGPGLSANKETSDHQETTHAKKDLTKNDDTGELEEASLGSNISYLESSSRSYSDDGLSLDETIITSERDGPRSKSPPTAPHHAPNINNTVFQATFTDDIPSVRYAVSATSSEYPSFDRYHCPSNPTATLGDSATFSRDNIELTETGDVYTDDTKEEGNRGMETIDEDIASDDTKDFEQSFKMGQEESKDKVDSKTKTSLNGDDKYKIMNEKELGSDDVENFNSFPDESGGGNPQSRSFNSDDESEDFNRDHKMVENVVHEAGDQAQETSTYSEEGLSRIVSNGMTGKDTEDEVPIETDNSHVMHASEVTNDQETMASNEDAEIFLIQDNEDEDGDSGKFTLSQESALVFSVSSSDSETSYRRYQAVSGVIPIGNFNPEQLRLQSHTEEGLKLDNSNDATESNPKQNEGENLDLQEQEIASVHKIITNHDRNHASDEPGNSEPYHQENDESEIIDAAKSDPKQNEGENLDSQEEKISSVQESITNHDKNDTSEEPGHNEPYNGQNNESKILESILQEEDGDDEELSSLHFQVPSVNMNENVESGTEEVNDSSKVGSTLSSESDQNECDETCDKSNSDNLLVKENPFQTGEENTEQICEGSSFDRKKSIFDSSSDSQQLGVNSTGNLMINQRIVENKEDCDTDHLLTDARNAFAHSSEVENDDMDPGIQPVESDLNDAGGGRSNLVPKASGMLRNNSMGGNVEVAGLKITDTLNHKDYLVMDDTIERKEIQKGNLMQEMEEQHNNEVKISKAPECDNIQNESNNAHEEVLRVPVEEKLKQLFRNMASSSGPRMIRGSNTIIRNEAERYQTEFSLPKGSSPWWLSDKKINDRVENHSYFIVWRRKATWYLEQLNQSDSLLQRRIAENGVTLKKTQVEQRRPSTKVFWWPVSTEVREESPQVVSNKNRKWYFEALHHETEAESSDENASIKESSPHHMLRQKVLNTSNRSWLVASDGREKILKAIEANQSNNSSQSNKENSQPSQRVEVSGVSSTISVDQPESRSVETAITKLKSDIAVTLASAENKQRSAIQVSFKNPVLAILKRQSVDNELILLKNTKSRVKFVPQYKSPTPQLMDLIEGIRSDSVTRRSNASGTVKLMASQKKNVTMLGSAEGLLDALLFAAKLECEGYDAEANAVTRNRALTTMALLSQAQENRRLICEHNDLIDVLFDILMSDNKDGRLHACSCFAALAKTEENRDILAEKKGLTSELANILVKLKETPAADKNEMGVEGDPVSASKRIASATRLNACATLLHLSKQCNISVKICQDPPTLECLATCSMDLDDPVHSRCLETICYLSRFPANNVILAENVVLEALFKCGTSSNQNDRLWTLRAMQNITANAMNHGLIVSEKFLEVLCTSAQNVENLEESEAAISVIGNLCTDPSFMVQVTNTENLMRALVTAAHSTKYSQESQFISCDALATVAMWLKKVAEGGTVPKGFTFDSLPTFQIAGYMRYSVS